MSLFNELKRRNVFRAGGAYAVVAWLVMQVTVTFSPALYLPEWFPSAVAFLLIIGFPIALFFAWAYELTPDGIKREVEADDTAPTTRQSGSRLNYLIIGALALVVMYTVVSRDKVSIDPHVSIDTLVARPSVVVLPFTNTSGDEAQDYLAFGITDEIILGLQRYNDFPVISRNVSLDFKGAGVNAEHFAKSLGASYWIEGSVHTVSDGIRVLATLVQSGGRQVWADRFQREVGRDKLFELSDQLVAKAADAIQESEIRRIAQIERPPADAWEHYVKGLAIVLAFDPKNYETARQHLDQALEIAPEMAEAWWARGELEAISYMSQPLSETADIEDLYTIIKYFRKSHEISPFHGAACGCLGFMLTAVGQADEARAVFEQAVEAKPLSASLRIDYAFYLQWSGRFAEAMENVDLAQKLGARGQDLSWIWLLRSIDALENGDSVAALDAINRSIFIDNNFQNAPAAVAILYVLGEKDHAARMLAELRHQFPGASPQNPVLYVALKPIDDILASRRERGEQNVPPDIKEIYHLLSKKDR